ncbi:MAG: protein kinase [Catenulispora sp.]|nr:protein kinase [Catenulispora sp.]
MRRRMGAGVEELRGTDPRRIGPYDLVAVLGSGGMGRVYLGRTPAGVTAAVKVIHADLARDPEFRRRFRREVETTAAITGPRLAAVLDSDVDAEHPWLATEYVAGPSLAAAVTENGPLPPQAALAVAAGVAEALAAIHAQGLVHRDVKPSNVLLAPDGPRLIDFGIARGAADSRLTRTGVALGTPQFMAPEQIQGDRETRAPADLFALAGVLLFAMTGQYPFGEGSAVTLLYRIVHEAPRLEPVPPDLRPLLAACLNKDPEARPTAVEVAEHLSRLLDPAPQQNLAPLQDPERTVEVATGRGEATAGFPRQQPVVADTMTGARGGATTGAMTGAMSGAMAGAMAGALTDAVTGAPTDRLTPVSALPTQSVALATQSAAAAPYPSGLAGPPPPLHPPTSPGAQAPNRWRKPAAIGAGVVAGVAALVVAISLGSGDGGSQGTGSAGGGRVANEIADPIPSSLGTGTGVLLPNGSSGGAAPSQSPDASGQTPATPGRPDGSPANGSTGGSAAGPTSAAGSTGAAGPTGATTAGSKPGAPASGTTGTSQPKGTSSGPASHTSAPPPSSAGPTTAPSSSAGSGSGVPTRVSADSTARVIQSAYDSKCVTAAAESDGSKWYVSGSCSGAPAQWKVWHGTSTSAGLPTWQFESTSYPGYCMSAAWTLSSQNWQLVPCSAGDEWQWWAASEASGSTMLNLWHDTTHCLVNNQGIDSEKCADNPNNLPSVYFYWKVK